MSRRLFVILAAALLAASCSSGDTLATVNGVAVTRDDVLGMNPGYEDPVGVLTGADLRQDVTNLIVLEVAVQAAQENYGVSIDESAITDRIANPPERWATFVVPIDDGSDETRRRAIVSLVVDAVIPQQVAEDYGGWAGLLDSNPELVAKTCVRHINVATEEEGDDVLARLLAGEDFVALAAEVSLDQDSPDGLITGPDGACLTWYSAYAPEFAAAAATAELNTPSGPVPFLDGYSVFRVEDRFMPASAEELAATPMDYLDLNVVGSYYSAWVSDELRVADIDVSSALGSWSADALGIVAPGE